MNAPTKAMTAGEARCPAPSVQDVLRADGDAAFSRPHTGSTHINSSAMPTSPMAATPIRTSSRPRSTGCGRRRGNGPAARSISPRPATIMSTMSARISLIVMRTDDGDIKAYLQRLPAPRHQAEAELQRGLVARAALPVSRLDVEPRRRLAELPCAWDFPHVDREKFRLPEARVGTWGGFVFINMDEDATPLEEYLAPLPDHSAHADSRIATSRCTSRRSCRATGRSHPRRSWNPITRPSPTRSC